VLLPRGRLSFEVGPHDRAMPVILDPILDYSTALSSINADGAVIIAAPHDNLLIAGFDALSIPPTGIRSKWFAPHQIAITIQAKRVVVVASSRSSIQPVMSFYHFLWESRHSTTGYRSRSGRNPRCRRKPFGSESSRGHCRRDGMLKHRALERSWLT
jgi:hypothetical protein